MKYNISGSEHTGDGSICAVAAQRTAYMGNRINKRTIGRIDFQEASRNEKYRYRD
jgi:hypothetical protein